MAPRSPFLYVPLLLVGLRLLLGPLLLWGALRTVPGWLLTSALIAAFVSDVFDGVIARKLDVATPRLREFDSWTDAIFCGCVALAVWGMYHSAVFALWPLVALWLGTDCAALGFDWLKFRRFAAYHALSAKLGGACLFIGVLALFGWGDSRALGSGLAVAALGHVEHMAMTYLLPRWTPDVLSVWHARRLHQMNIAD